MSADVDRWLEALERRHLADLEFPEVTRALRALSSAYVERRAAAVAGRRTLDGSGKRAAFALYYGPLHFLAATRILELLDRSRHGQLERTSIVDLGCGTGAVGAALARALGIGHVHGIDRHPWVLDEARHTYDAFGLETSLARREVGRWTAPRRPAVIAAGYVVNELPDAERAALLSSLTRSVDQGSAVFILEPLARAITPWWPDWVSAFAVQGARADEWKLTVEPPPLVSRLGAAAGLTTPSIAVKTISVGF